MKSAKRPCVIRHMVPSVDGRIIVDRWKLPPTLHSEYERMAASFKADASMIGRVSMEPYAGEGRSAARSWPRISSMN